MKKAFPTSWYPWPSEDNHACPVLVEPLSGSMDQSKSWLGHDKDLPPPRPHWDQRHSFYVFPPPPHGCFRLAWPGPQPPHWPLVTNFPCYACRSLAKMLS